MEICGCVFYAQNGSCHYLNWDVHFLIIFLLLALEQSLFNKNCLNKKFVLVTFLWIESKMVILGIGIGILFITHVFEQLDPPSFLSLHSL